MSKPIKKEAISRMKKIELWTDGKFKMIVLSSLIASITATIWLLNTTRPLEDKYQKLMNTKQLYIIDPAGQKYITTASSSQKDTYKELAKILVKKMYEFNGNEYKSNLDFVKSFTEQKTFDMYKESLSATIENAQLLGASFSVEIESMYTTRTSDSYVIEIYFKHIETSRTTSSTSNFKVTYDLRTSTSTIDNQFGIYLDNFTLITGKELEEDKIERDKRDREIQEREEIKNEK
jgi:hypothetical protein